jgi:GAF domain-containing protein
MIEWLRKLIVLNFEDEELNRRGFNLNVILLLTLIVMLMGIVAMLFQIGKRPASYLIPNTMFIVIAALVMVFCFYLSRRGNVQAGSIIFVAMMTLACIGAVIVGGTRGALPVILVIPLAAAGTTLGGNTSLGIALLSVITLVVVGLLENKGILKVEYASPETTVLLNMFDVGFGLLFATLSIWLAGYSLRQSLERTRQAASEAEYYQQEAEKSLAAEQATRDRLEFAITNYSKFLDRISQKDYQARLTLTEDDENLALLEQQLNTTVETLVTALTESETARKQAEAAQRRYLLQAWQDYSQSGAQTHFEISKPEKSTPETDLVPSFIEALDKQDPVISSASSSSDAGPAYDLAIPLKLRGVIIGLLGIRRRDQKNPWSDREKVLVEAVAERLALSIDGLRLMDESQRRAAQEHLIGDVTGKIRETLDVETVIKNAVGEIRQALGLHDVLIQLESPQLSQKDNSPKPEPTRDSIA